MIKILNKLYPLKSIMYIEGVNNMSVFTFSGGQSIIYSKTLKSHDLPENFMRIHKHIIVNRDHVKEYQYKGKLVLMNDGNTFTVSRRKLKEFREWIENETLPNNH